MLVIYFNAAFKMPQVPMYFEELRSILSIWNEIIADVDDGYQIFLDAMHNFGLMRSDVLGIKGRHAYIWVIEPQDYNSISKLWGDGEEVKDDIFGLLTKDADPLRILDTGDAPGYGDKWYKASKDVISALKAAMTKLSRKSLQTICKHRNDEIARLWKNKHTMTRGNAPGMQKCNAKTSELVDFAITKKASSPRKSGAMRR